MTNPGNAVGTNGAFGGRTSVNAFNDVLSAFQSRGILSGWEITPNSGMTVAIGGNGTVRDSAIAQDNVGNKTSVNNISQAPINLTIAGAPVSNSRIDAIVAYVDNPPSGTATVTDNYGACGLIDVQGVAASSPVAPNDAAIRTAITADGASGTTAYYVILGYVTVATGTTDITSNMITAGPYAQIGKNQIAARAVTSDKIDCETIESTRTDNNKNLTSDWLDISTLPSNAAINDVIVGRILIKNTSSTNPAEVSVVLTNPDNTIWEYQEGVIPANGVLTMVVWQRCAYNGGVKLRAKVVNGTASTQYSGILKIRQLSQ